jgi:predicted acetyltransferase
LIALNGAAERGLLGFLAAQQEQAAAIHIVRAPDEPLGMAAAEPVGYPDRRMEFVMHELYQGSAGILMRILDVPGALAARRIPSHVSGALTLIVADPEPPDAGPWHVQFGEGRVTCSEVQPPLPLGEGRGEGPHSTANVSDPHPNPLPWGEGTTNAGHISTDIPTLSALYAGSLTAATASRLGRLDGDDNAIELLDAALAVSPLVVQRADWF